MNSQNKFGYKVDVQVYGYLILLQTNWNELTKRNKPSVKTYCKATLLSWSKTNGSMKLKCKVVLFIHYWVISLIVIIIFVFALSIVYPLQKTYTDM